METLNSWERLEKSVGKGVTVIKFKKKTPYEQIVDGVREMRTKEILENAKVGIPKYSKEEKKKIKKDMQNYLNSLERKYGKH